MPTVSYAKLINLGNYENERIEFTDEVGPEETQEEAFNRVRQWVEEHGNGVDGRKKLETQRVQLQNEIYSAQGKLRSVQTEHMQLVVKYDELRSLLAKHGVDIPELNPYYTMMKYEDNKVDDDQADDDEDFEEPHP